MDISDLNHTTQEASSVSPSSNLIIPRKSTEIEDLKIQSRHRFDCYELNLLELWAELNFSLIVDTGHGHLLGH